jgi:hypothetical protein
VRGLRDRLEANARVSSALRAESQPIADHALTETLLRLQVACELALDALPKLPRDTERELRDHVQGLCRVVERELDEIKPGWQAGGAAPARGHA